MGRGQRPADKEHERAGDNDRDPAAEEHVPGVGKGEDALACSQVGVEAMQDRVPGQASQQNDDAGGYYPRRERYELLRAASHVVLSEQVEEYGQA